MKSKVPRFAGELEAVVIHPFSLQIVVVDLSPNNRWSVDPRCFSSHFSKSFSSIRHVLQSAWSLWQASLWSSTACIQADLKIIAFLNWSSGGGLDDVECAINASFSSAIANGSGVPEVESSSATLLDGAALSVQKWLIDWERERQRER